MMFLDTAAKRLSEPKKRCQECHMSNAQSYSMVPVCNRQRTYLLVVFLRMCRSYTLHLMSWYITAHDKFYQSSSHISTVSDNYWGEKTWIQGYQWTTLLINQLTGTGTHIAYTYMYLLQPCCFLCKLSCTYDLFVYSGPFHAYTSVPLMKLVMQWLWSSVSVPCLCASPSATNALLSFQHPQSTCMYQSLLLMPGFPLLISLSIWPLSVSPRPSFPLVCCQPCTVATCTMWNWRTMYGTNGARLSEPHTSSCSLFAFSVPQCTLHSTASTGEICMVAHSMYVFSKPKYMSCSLSLMLYTGLPGAVDSAVRVPPDLTQLRPQVVQQPHPLHSVGFRPDAASSLLPGTGV